jgi:hypothetical protein
MRVRAGQLVRVRLRVQVYRGRLRTVGFRVRIPRGASGRTTVNIKGPDAPVGTGMSQGLAGALTSLLSFSDSSGPPPSTSAISSLSDLRQAIAGLANYDGLYASVRGHAKRPVYRSRSLLITGGATLRFVVAR